jgi:hypothetical protein
MKKWQFLSLALLLVCLPVLSSCQLLGIGGKSKDQVYLEQQLELMRQQQAAAQKAQEDYYQAIQKGLQDYANQLQQYQQAQLQQQLQALQQQQQQATEIPYN